MKRYSICLLVLMFFYGCAIKPIPDLKPVIELEMEGMLIFMQGESFFLPAEPDSLFPPEFTEYNFIGLALKNPSRGIDRSYMQEIGAVEYGVSFHPHTPVRCWTGYSDDNYFIKHDSCYICYGTIKLTGWEELRAIWGCYNNGDPVTHYFTWDIIMDDFPINCNVLEEWGLRYEVLNTETIDRRQLHEFLTGVCKNKLQTRPERDNNAANQ